MMDACINKLIRQRMVIEGNQSFKVSELTKQAKFMAIVLRNEFLLRDPRGFPETINHRVSLLVAEKELTISTEAGEAVIILNQSKVMRQGQSTSNGISLIHFFSELGSHILDTYLVVLLALDAIIQGNIVVKEKSLIESIHFAIIDMYNDNLLPSLQTCLQETIKTAIHRFADLKMINKQTYLNQNGSRVSYISGEIDK